ncbi:MAG: hypothetical protein ACE5KE_03690 [Methanosarcinales archaeon]
MKKTILTGIIGIAVGFASFYLKIDDIPIILIILIVVVLTYIQKFIYPYLNIDVDNFGVKDLLYIGFMTFDFWFVSWTLLLN